MNTYTDSKQERTEPLTDLDERDVRALTERMTVLDAGPDVWTVVGENGGTYTVDTRDAPRCDCADHTHRNVRCKHIRRVAYATGERTIPAYVDRDDVDEHLGRHVNGPVFAGVDAVDTTSEQPVATDGGSDPSDWTFTDTSANPTGVCERDGCDGPQRKSLTVPGEGKRIVCNDCYHAYRDRGRSAGARAVVGAGQ